MAQAIGEFFTSLIGESFNLKGQDVSWLTPDTEKYYQNITAVDVKVPELSYTDQFLSQSNLLKLTKSLFETQRRQATMRGDGKGVHTFDYFAGIVPKFATKWARVNHINDSTPLGIASSIEVLDHLNDLFLKEHYELFRMPQGHELPGKTGRPDVNLFRQHTYTQNRDGSHSFKPNESFSVDDMRSMDVFNPRDRRVDTDSSKYRYGNRIPQWQLIGSGSQKVNMVDRADVDGLHTRRPDEASLEQPTRGYDMSGITGSTYTTISRGEQAASRRKTATMRQKSYSEPL